MVIYQHPSHLLISRILTGNTVGLGGLERGNRAIPITLMLANKLFHVLYLSASLKHTTYQKKNSLSLFVLQLLTWHFFCDKCRPAIWTLTTLFHNSVTLDSYSSGCQHELWFHISRRQTGKDTDDLIFSPGNWTSAIHRVNYWMLPCHISVTNDGVKQIL